MNAMGLALVICMVSAIIGILGAVVGALALIKVEAMERSTHSLQYVPLSEEIDEANTEYIKSQSWATTDSSLKDQKKMYEEDLEDQMPEFLPSEEDKKLYSF